MMANPIYCALCGAENYNPVRCKYCGSMSFTKNAPAPAGKIPKPVPATSFPKITNITQGPKKPDLPDPKAKAAEKQKLIAASAQDEGNEAETYEVLPGAILSAGSQGPSGQMDLLEMLAVFSTQGYVEAKSLPPQSVDPEDDPGVAAAMEQAKQEAQGKAQTKISKYSVKIEIPKELLDLPDAALAKAKPVLAPKQDKKPYTGWMPRNRRPEADVAEEPAPPRLYDFEEAL